MGRLHQLDAGRGRAAEGDPLGIGQGDGEARIVRKDRAGQGGDEDRGGRLAGSEGQGAGDRDVVGAGHGRAIRGGIRDGGGGREVPFPVHGDRGERAGRDLRLGRVEPDVIARLDLPAEVLKGGEIQGSEGLAGAVRDDRVHQHLLASGGQPLGPVGESGVERDGPPVNRGRGRADEAGADDRSAPGCGTGPQLADPQDMAELVLGHGEEIDLIRADPGAVLTEIEAGVGGGVEGDRAAPEPDVGGDRQQRSGLPSRGHQVQPGLVALGRIASRAALAGLGPSDRPPSDVDDQRIGRDARVGDVASPAGGGVGDHGRPGVGPDGDDRQEGIAQAAGDGVGGLLHQVPLGLGVEEVAGVEVVVDLDRHGQEVAGFERLGAVGPTDAPGSDARRHRGRPPGSGVVSRAAHESPGWSRDPRGGFPSPSMVADPADVGKARSGRSAGLAEGPGVCSAPAPRWWGWGRSVTILAKRAARLSTLQTLPLALDRPR